MGRYSEYYDRATRSNFPIPTRPDGATGTAGGGSVGGGSVAEKTVRQAIDPEGLPEEYSYASSSAGLRRKDTHELPLFKRFIQQDGLSLEEALGFTYHGILISNFTPQWIHIRGPEDYWIPPNFFGVQIPVYDGSNKAWLTFDAPPGFTQPGANAAQFVLIKFVENLVEPLAGYDISGLSGAQGVEATNVTQVGGVAVTPATGDGDAIGTITGMPVFGVMSLFNGSTRDRMRSLGSAGDGLGVALVSQPSSTPLNANANNAVATVTIGAVAGQRHRITSLSASYTAVASVGALQIALSDTVTTQTWNVPSGLGAGNPVGISLAEGGEFFAVNTAVTATLTASGAVGSLGQVNVSKLTA